jgi:hypothetical protein
MGNKSPENKWALYFERRRGTSYAGVLVQVQQTIAKKLH